MIRALLCFVLVWGGPAVATPYEISGQKVEVTPMITGLETPWAFGFLPDGAVLVTEREGRLLHVAPDGTRRTVQGLPRVRATGQGGLLDVMIPRDFATSREVFLSYAAPQGSGAGTALGVGRLSIDGSRLTDFKQLFALTKGSSGGRHFGSRIVEGRDGYLYLTIGDRGDAPRAQDLGVENGSVIRIARNGAVPQGNPFTAVTGAQPEIWSYGHRNPQGAALGLDGKLWITEHGAQGGDELNLIAKGRNYGWPVISYGRHYSGARIGQGTSKEGMMQPVRYWDPSFAPSGLMIYSGKLWPQWRGDFFMGSLKFGQIVHLDADLRRPQENRIELGETDRLRDIREAPDGTIWFMSVGNGAIYRISPETR